MELKRRAQSLCEQKDLEGDKKLEVQQTVEDTEQQWRTVLRAAEETQRYRKLLVFLRGTLHLDFSFHMNVTMQAQLQISCLKLVLQV